VVMPEGGILTAVPVDVPFLRLAPLMPKGIVTLIVSTHDTVGSFIAISNGLYNFHDGGDDYDRRALRVPCSSNNDGHRNSIDSLLPSAEGGRGKPQLAASLEPYVVTRDLCTRHCVHHVIGLDAQLIVVQILSMDAATATMTSGVADGAIIVPCFQHYDGIAVPCSSDNATNVLMTVVFAVPCSSDNATNVPMTVVSVESTSNNATTVPTTVVSVESNTFVVDDLVELPREKSTVGLADFDNRFLIEGGPNRLQRSEAPRPFRSVSGAVVHSSVCTGTWTGSWTVPLGVSSSTRSELDVCSVCCEPDVRSRPDVCSTGASPEM
jgi:hypothetical protein